MYHVKQVRNGWRVIPDAVKGRASVYETQADAQRRADFLNAMGVK